MSEWVWCGLSSEAPAVKQQQQPGFRRQQQQQRLKRLVVARPAGTLRAGPSYVVAALGGPWLVVRERRERRHSNAAPGPGEELARHPLIGGGPRVDVGHYSPPDLGTTVIR